MATERRSRRVRDASIEEVEGVVRGLMENRVVHRDYAWWAWNGPDGEVRECRSLARLVFGVRFPRLTASIAYLADAFGYVREALDVWR